MIATAFKPVKVRRAKLCRLSQQYQDAVDNAWECMGIAGDCKVRIETYATADIRALLDIWQWPATLAGLKGRDSKDDRARVRKIMALIRTEGAWPYVSYWTGDMEGLMETTQEDDYVSVPNHGDGWHRIVACIELGLPTIDILFLEGKQ